MTNPPTTRDEIIKVWKELDTKSEKPWVGQPEVAKALKISIHWIRKLFVGESLTEMKRQHGIRLSPQEVHRSDDELLAVLDSVVSKHNDIPCWNVLMHETGIAESTWKKRLGGHKGAPKEEVYSRYEQWLRANHPESPNLARVTGFMHSPGESETPPPVGNASAPRRVQVPTYQRTDARRFGPRLNFRNLTHEPTNEQGVVFLFGMVSKELGFESIEYLGTDFPDCQGKWKVDNQGWLQDVKIEFEFKSRSYDHPVDGCNVIVCWEDNWKDCPLPVIELKSEIKKLKDRHS